MADLIDRGDLLHNLRMMPMHKIFDRDVWEVNAVSYYVEQAPTIDAEPVQHGRWVYDSGFWTCTNCGHDEPCRDDDDPDKPRFKRCHSCGAIMDDAHSDEAAV